VAITGDPILPRTTAPDGVLTTMTTRRDDSEQDDEYDTAESLEAELKEERIAWVYRMLLEHKQEDWDDLLEAELEGLSDEEQEEYMVMIELAMEIIDEAGIAYYDEREEFIQQHGSIEAAEAAITQQYGSIEEVEAAARDILLARGILLEEEQKTETQDSRNDQVQSIVQQEIEKEHEDIWETSTAGETEEISLHIEEGKQVFWSWEMQSGVDRYIVWLDKWTTSKRWLLSVIKKREDVAWNFWDKRNQVTRCIGQED
jgi:hypothetical protein